MIRDQLHLEVPTGKMGQSDHQLRHLQGTEAFECDEIHDFIDFTVQKKKEKKIFGSKSKRIKTWLR